MLFIDILRMCGCGSIICFFRSVLIRVKTRTSVSIPCYLVRTVIHCFDFGKQEVRTYCNPQVCFWNILIGALL